MGWSRAGRTLSVLLAGVLLLSAATAGLAVGGSTADGAASDGAAAPAQTAESPALLQGFEADRTAFIITVYGNGSAEWRFRYERALNGSERDDFEAFAEEFNDDETELFTNFRTRARWLTDNGSQATGREMRATGFARDARVEGLAPQTQALGVVELSFRWEGFARPTDGGDVEAGDVFEGGLYVGPDQELAFTAGPNLAFVRAQPTEGRVLSGDSLAESDTVTWTGERSFTDQRPRVVLADAESVDDAGATSADDDDGRGLLLPMGVLLVVVALGGGAAVAYRSGALPPGGGAAAGAETDADAGDGGTGAGAGVCRRRRHRSEPGGRRQRGGTALRRGASHRSAGGPRRPDEAGRHRRGDRLVEVEGVDAAVGHGGRRPDLPAPGRPGEHRLAGRQRARRRRLAVRRRGVTAEPTAI